jgi:hypothetical protein
MLSGDCLASKPNKALKQDKKQFAVFRASNILANYFLPLNEALYVATCSSSCFCDLGIYLLGIYLLGIYLLGLCLFLFVFVVTLAA